MKSLCVFALILILATNGPAFAQVPPAKSATVDRDLLAGVEDEAPVRSADENYAETRAYNYLLVHAREFSLAELRRQAQTDVSFAHLFEEPNKYRGKLVLLKGRLRRLRRFDAPALAAKQGTPDLYEGWLYTAGSFSNPFCILASEVGAGVHVGEKVDEEVSFAGFFFKKYRYKAGDGWRDAPLLIGRGIELDAAPAEPVPSLLGPINGPTLFALLGAAVLVALVVAWRLRAGDRAVRARLRKIREDRID